MARKLKTSAFVFAFAGAVFLFGAVGMGLLSVKVRSAALRSRPSFLGRRIAHLPYGSQVRVLTKRGSWIEVLDEKGRRGWVHFSALTKRKIIMRAGSERISPTASKEELTLATKGFDERVERNYRKLKPSLDFRWVDWMEEIKVSFEAMQSFLLEGKLAPREGGKQGR